MKYPVIILLAGIVFAGAKCGTAENKNKPEPLAVSALADTSVYNKFMKLGAGKVLNTGTVLIQNVTEAIAKHGTEYAIGFCNTEALPLTDSMAMTQHTSIKRVTDKTRNPANAADTSELRYMQALQQMTARGEKPKPRLQETGNKIIGYYPIITNDMCMKCHGAPSKIDANTLAKIRQLYPADSATGYLPNQLRGLWVVEMAKD